MSIVLSYAAVTSPISHQGSSKPVCFYSLLNSTLYNFVKFAYSVTFFTYHRNIDSAIHGVFTYTKFSMQVRFFNYLYLFSKWSVPPESEIFEISSNKTSLLRFESLCVYPENPSEFQNFSLLLTSCIYYKQ